MSMRGVASEYIFRLPPEAGSQGAAINGIMVDPVTYVVCSLGLRFHAFDDETTFTSSTTVIAFGGRHGDNTDTTIIRFDIARQEAESVGAGMYDFQM